MRHVLIGVPGFRVLWYQLLYKFRSFMIENQVMDTVESIYGRQKHVVITNRAQSSKPVLIYRLLPTKEKKKRSKQSESLSDR